MANMYPVIVGNEVSFLAEGNEHGLLTFWHDQQNMEDNCGYVLAGHCSKVESLSLSGHKKHCVSVGRADGTILQWDSSLHLESQPNRIASKPD
jgi:WD40 repeat protein